ncbi:MAG: N-acetylmuramoyl-L-alanine amidase [Deltaproteobacteria bacterium]|nr:N-acetylmuramoyl-L-alanine amidase [Deltaproteobacteria bacterium]
MVLNRLTFLAALLFATRSVAAPVVIDPGHGGEKTGAKTADGIAEETIVLEVSRSAKAALEAAGVSVVLTRESDVHLGLAERVSIANRLGARAFVSVHANWSPVQTRRGVEAYVVSAKLSEDTDAELVRLENEGEGAVPYAFQGAASDLDALLLELERQGAHEGSAKLSHAVERALGSVPALGPARGLRQAPFAVLVGARVPAVLVELGYLSHPVQGRELSSAENQRAAGRALARGIVEFLKRSPD